MAGRVACWGYPNPVSFRALTRDSPPPPSTIMVTTIGINGRAMRTTPFMPLTGTGHPRANNKPSLWRRLKESFADFWFQNPIPNFLCCTDPNTQIEVQLRRRQHNAVSAALMESFDYYGATSIIESVMLDMAADGHVLYQDPAPTEAPVTTTALVAPSPGVARIEGRPTLRPPAIMPVAVAPPAVHAAVSVIELAQAMYTPLPEVNEAELMDRALVPVAHRPPPAGAHDMLVLALAHAIYTPLPVGDEDELAEPSDVVMAPVIVPTVTPRRGLREVRFYPRFAGSVVVELRSRLGQLGRNVPGNLLIVEREALRLMRKYKVREVDSVAHLPSIISSYFVEDIHYRVETSRSRMTRMQRWLMSEDESPAPAFTPLA